MALKIREVRAFLVSKKKLQCDAFEGANHVIFHLQVAGSRVPLPAVLTLERGSGEISDRNFKGLADDIGLTKKGLEEGVNCTVGRPCLLLCIVSRLLSKFVERQERLSHGPISQKERALLVEDLARIGVEAQRLLDEISSEVREPGPWGKAEAHELRRARETMLRIAEFPALEMVTTCWLKWAQLDAETTQA
jgi:hypothetical protein